MKPEIGPVVFLEYKVYVVQAKPPLAGRAILCKAPYHLVGYAAAVVGYGYPEQAAGLLRYGEDYAAVVPVGKAVKYGVFHKGLEYELWDYTVNVFLVAPCGIGKASGEAYALYAYVAVQKLQLVPK